MLTLLALTLAAAAPNGGRPLTLHGECIYPPKIAEALPDAIQLICDTVEVTPDGVVTTVAGTTAAGTADGPAATATFNNPYGIVVDGDGNIYVADLTSALIRKITPDGNVTTIAGSSVGFADGLSNTAKFNQPTDLAINGDGNIIVADLTNRRIRIIKPVH